MKAKNPIALHKAFKKNGVVVVVNEDYKVIRGDDKVFRVLDVFIEKGENFRAVCKKIIDEAEGDILDFYLDRKSEKVIGAYLGYKL